MNHSNGTSVADRGAALVRWIWRRIFYIATPVLLVLGITNLTIAMNASAEAARASARVAEEQKQRTLQLEQLYEHQRVTFCGFYEPIAEAGKMPPPTGQPRSELGKSIAKGTETVVGADGLACTPDPKDGR